MKLAACYCQFQRTAESEWENGLAVTTDHGLSSVVLIVPEGAEGSDDALSEVWNYRLDWTACMYPPGHLR